MTIKRVGPLSCAKIAAALYAVLGLVAGVFFSLAAIAGAFAANQEAAGAMGVVFGVGAIVVLPIVYGCIGFVGDADPGRRLQRARQAVGGVEVDIS